GAAGQGRGAYLGPVYPYYSWTTGMADRLLEQAVRWAAFGGVDRIDNYSVAVQEGDVLSITTTTPGDGVNQPANDLDVVLELYDAGGTKVVSNDNGAADGRNAAVNYVVPTGGAGTYRIAVVRSSGAGDYTLEVQGATGSANTPLTVTSSSITDATTFAAFPGSVTLAFSNGLAYGSVQASD
ncbi:unnamed protein product, partial [Phaeothamnion confervicola]